MRQGFAEDPSEERVVAGGQVGNLLHVTHDRADHRMREWTPWLDVVGHVAVQCEFGVLGGVPGPPGLAEIVVPHLEPRSDGHPRCRATPVRSPKSRQAVRRLSRTAGHADPGQCRSKRTARSRPCRRACLRLPEKRWTSSPSKPSHLFLPIAVPAAPLRDTADSSQSMNSRFAMLARSVLTPPPFEKATVTSSSVRVSLEETTMPSPRRG